VDARSLWVRPARELWLFVAPRRRRDLVEVRHDGTASLGHVVQALGVPLTEVGALRADGAVVEPSHRPRPGAVIEVPPVERPQRIPGWSQRFALDVHLGTLARRLRLLGVDTSYRHDAADDDLVRHANAEQRVLLTQDRGLLKRRALQAGAYVRGDRPDDQLTDVLDRFAPPLRPWTRCLRCNGELEPVPKHEIAHRLEPGTRRCYDRFARCRRCGQVYWQGAHGRRLRGIVAAAGRHG
jgi:uncharacterized protein with PIN domain